MALSVRSLTPEEKESSMALPLPNPPNPPPPPPPPPTTTTPTPVLRPADSLPKPIIPLRLPVSLPKPWMRPCKYPQETDAGEPFKGK
jgi:hypothetical protein